MKKAVPHLVFGVIYFVAVCVLDTALDSVSEGAANTVLGVLIPFAAAPLALFFARRAGVLAPRGLLVTAAIIAVVGYVAITLLCQSLAGDARDTMTLLSLVRVGGLPFVLSTVAFLVAPLMWLRLRLPTTMPG